MSTSTDERSIGTPGVQAAGWPVDLLQSVWSQQQGLLTERIGVIEQAALALERGSLGEPLRARAQRAAHMLAGSVGIFGFDLASQVAHELEAELAGPTVKQASRIRGALSRLKLDIVVARDH